MDQCTDKCRCLTGINQDVAYECEQPCESGYFFESFNCDCYPDQPACPNGAVATVVSYIQVRQGIGGTETTFINVAGATPGGPARALGDTLEIYASGEWAEVAALPYAVGDLYGGKAIVSIIRQATIAASCS